MSKSLHSEMPNAIKVADTQQKIAIKTSPAIHFSRAKKENRKKIGKERKLVAKNPYFLATLNSFSLITSWEMETLFFCCSPECQSICLFLLPPGLLFIMPRNVFCLSSMGWEKESKKGKQPLSWKLFLGIRAFAINEEIIVGKGWMLCVSKDTEE